MQSCAALPAGPPLAVLVAPVWRGHMRAVARDPAGRRLFVVLSPTETDHRRSAELIGWLFDLTAAESELVRLVLSNPFWRSVNL